MPRATVVSLTLLLASPAQGQDALSQGIDAEDLEGPGIEVPDAWIESVRELDADGDVRAVIDAFEALIAPQELKAPHGGDRDDHGYVNPLFINLDGDPHAEMIALIGRDRHHPMLAIFDRDDDGWTLVFTKTFYVFHRLPEVEIANVPSPHKTFYIRWLYGRGTGFFHDRYHVFKLIDGRVHHVLETVHRYWDSAYGEGLQPEVACRLRVDGVERDRLWLRCEYHFAYSELSEDETEFRTFPVFEGHLSAPYIWNPDTTSYESPYGVSTRWLDPDALRTYGGTSFLEHFRSDVEHRLAEGEPAETERLKRWLEAEDSDTSRAILEAVE